MIEQQIISLPNQNQIYKKPTVSTWKKVPIILNQSPLSAIKEIVNQAKQMDYIKIGIIGTQHTGKTTLAKFLAHIIHRMANDELHIPYQVKIFAKKELINFEETIQHLPPANYIMLFDDISFLKGDINAQQLEKIKQAETTIRHFPDKKDVKIIQIDNYHYTRGHDKYLRQSDYKFLTSVGSEEKDNIISMTGPQYANLIMKFQKTQNSKFNTGYFTFDLGRKGKPFAYKYRDPFIPVLFWNGSSLRNLITPTREWIDPACSICATAEGIRDDNFDLDKFKEQFEKRYGGAAKTAIKIILKSVGLNTWSDKTSRAIYDLNKVMNERNFDIWLLAQKFNLELKNSRYSYQVSKMLKDADKTETVNTEDVNENNIGEHIPWEKTHTLPKKARSDNQKDEEYTM